MRPIPSPTTPAHRDPPPARGFSLVELLTVIAILAIVIAIIIPAIAGARNAAKKADTLNTLTQVGQSCGQFETDNKRPPGFFSTAALASTTNATANGGGGRGVTAMDGLLLDLMGGVVKTAVPGSFKLGPTGATEVDVDPSQIGGTSQNASGGIARGYVSLGKTQLVYQGYDPVGNTITDAKKRMAGVDASYPNAFRMPTLVDSWGEPVLAWIQNDAPGTAGSFAEINSPAGRADARFYWATNAGFLMAEQLGKVNENQNRGLLYGAVSPANRIKTMEALLGSPGNPVPNVNPPRANGPRGSVILQSAGANGIYLSGDERVGRTGATNGVQYTPNQDPFAGGASDDVITAGN